jgi:hypothetical protein
MQKLCIGGRFASTSSHGQTVKVANNNLLCAAGEYKGRPVPDDRYAILDGWIHGGSTEQIRRNAHGKQGLVRNDACHGG